MKVGSGSTIERARRAVSRRLESYDQERLVEVGRVNLILHKPQCFMQERRCEKVSEWCEKYF